MPIWTHARRFFSARGKSPIRNASECALLLAVIAVAIYVPRGEPIVRLAAVVFGTAVIGFVTVLAFGTLSARQRREG